MPTKPRPATTEVPVVAAADRGVAVTAAALRIALGVLWLANIHWKRPPDFGLRQRNGLFRYVDAGARTSVLPPYRWFSREVVLGNYRFFGWLILILEIVLAAGLVLGLATRLWAVLGAVLSITIGLSVMNYQQEWPWTYYLMVLAHLALLGLVAGRFAGLDGLLRSSSGDHPSWTGSARRFGLALGACAVVVGVMGVIAGVDDDFTAHVGSLVGVRSLELKLFWFNTLAALLSLGLGVVAVLGVVGRKTALVLGSAAAFVALAVLQLVLWHNPVSGETGGFLGGNGGNVAYWLTLGIGLAALALPRGFRRWLGPTMS